MLKIKTFSFIIALKRFKRNSVIKKKRSHVLCKYLGISRGLFNKLLAEGLKQGLIEDLGNGYYQIIQFKEVIRDLNKATDLYYGRYNILQDKNTSYYEIKLLVENQLIKSNIYDRQNFIINKVKDLNSRKSRTVIKALKNLQKTNKFYRKSADEIQAMTNLDIRTSCRSVASILGSSIGKANKILNSHILFNRKIYSFWVKGKNKYDLMRLENLYPNFTIIPTLSGYFKVCSGSVLELML